MVVGRPRSSNSAAPPAGPGGEDADPLHPVAPSTRRRRGARRTAAAPPPQAGRCASADRRRAQSRGARACAARWRRAAPRRAARPPTRAAGRGCSRASRGCRRSRTSPRPPPGARRRRRRRSRLAPSRRARRRTTARRWRGRCRDRSRPSRASLVWTSSRARLSTARTLADHRPQRSAVHEVRGDGMVGVALADGERHRRAAPARGSSTTTSLPSTIP